MSKAFNLSLAVSLLSALVATSAYAQAVPGYQGGIVPVASSMPQVSQQAPAPAAAPTAQNPAPVASGLTTPAPASSSPSPARTLEDLAKQADTPAPAPSTAPVTVGPPLMTPASFQAQMAGLMPPKAEKPLPALRALEGGSAAQTAKLAYSGFVYSVQVGEPVGPSGWTLKAIHENNATVTITEKKGKKSVEKTLYLATVDPDGSSGSSSELMPSTLPGLPPSVGGPIQTFKAVP